MPAAESVVYGAPDQVATGAGRASARRALVFAALGPLVLGYLGVAAVLALVMATAPGGDFSLSGALLAAGPAWLAALHVPITLAGHAIGTLPLLPTVLLLALVARSARTAAVRIGLSEPRDATRVIGPIAAAHAGGAMLIALVCHGPVDASPILAFVIAGALAGIGATAGVAGPCALVPAALRRADHATVTGLRAGALAALGLVAIGTVVYLVALIASWSTAVALFRQAAPGFGSGLGMLLLSVAYLPNALIGTLSFAAGPGFGIGVVTVAQWHFHAGPVPPVPLFAPVPAVEAHWWVFLMLLPAAVGALTGLACRAAGDQAPARLRAVALAALAAAVSWLILAALAGGSLAGGRFDPVTVPAGSLAASVFLLVALPAAGTMWLAAKAPAILAPDDEDEYQDDEDDEEPEPEIDTEDAPEVT